MEPIPLTQLEADPENVRKVVDADGIAELAASIQAHGLMQNLVVRRKPKTKTKYLVTAGGRRLAALQLLAEQGVIEQSHEIPCQVLEEANATETSLAENVSRRDMAPIDAFEAFASLRDDGMSVADIASRFGITEALVEKRMRLGNLAPELRDAMRAGHLSLDAAMVFARRPDPALQLAVWKELGGKPGSPFHASSYSIRRGLDDGGVPSDARTARFVGVEAYVAAGGGFERDLFDDDGAGVLTDPDLLDQLVSEKLEAQAQVLRDDGWAWVEVMPDMAWDATHGMQRVYPVPVEDAKADAEYEGLAEQLEALEEITFERDLTSEEEETFGTLETRMDEIERGRRSEYAPDDKDRAGVFVTISHNGELRCEHGFVRPGDAKAASSGKVTGDLGGSETVPAGPKPMSNALLADLATARNAVFQAHLAEAPEAAFDLLVFALASGLLTHASTGLTVSTGGGHIPSDEAPAAAAFLATRSSLDVSWLEADRDATRFAAFCALPFEAREAIMAWCVAAMAIPRLGTTKPDHPIERTGQRIGIDARSHWTPSADTLFARLSKAQMLAILADCAGQAFAERHAGMKKGDLVDITHRFFAGDAHHHSPETGAKADAWLPEGMAFELPVEGDADETLQSGNDDEAAASAQDDVSANEVGAVQSDNTDADASVDAAVLDEPAEACAA